MGAIDEEADAHPPGHQDGKYRNPRCLLLHQSPGHRLYVHNAAYLAMKKRGIKKQELKKIESGRVCGTNAFLANTKPAHGRHM